MQLTYREWDTPDPELANPELSDSELFFWCQHAGHLQKF